MGLNFYYNEVVITPKNLGEKIVEVTGIKKPPVTAESFSDKELDYFSANFLSRIACFTKIHGNQLKAPVF